MLAQLLHIYKLRKLKKEWRLKNTHNYTYIGNYFPIDKVSVKKGTYGKLNVRVYNKSDFGLYIGNYCSIADNVYFLLGGEHPYTCLSTYPFKAMILKEGDEAVSKGPIIIEDDVWIGFGCTILSGVHIHQGAIIAAGSIVYSDVPPYAIYSNGKVIKYRFTQEIISELCKLNFDDINDENIRENLEQLYLDISCDSMNSIRNLFNNKRR